MQRRRDGKCHSCDETAVTPEGFCYAHDKRAHRLPGAIVAMLEDGLESAELKRASFDGVSDEKGTTITIRRANGWEETFEGSVTEFIRDRTRLYRQSWIIARIREVLLWSKSTDDGSMLEYDLLRRVKEGKWPHPSNLDELIKEIERLRSENAELSGFKHQVKTAFRNFSEEMADG